MDKKQSDELQRLQEKYLVDVAKLQMGRLSGNIQEMEWRLNGHPQEVGVDIQGGSGNAPFMAYTIDGAKTIPHQQASISEPVRQAPGSSKGGPGNEGDENGNLQAPATRNRQPRQEELMKSILVYPLWWSMLAASLALVIMSWLWIGPTIWAWGTTSGLGWRTALAIFGTFFAASLSIITMFAIWQPVIKIIWNDIKIKSALKENIQQVSQLRMEIDMQTMDTKIKGLDNLLRSSQNELRAYHDSALEQQRRSYLYAVVATWLGFFFILTGSVPYIVPIRVGDLALEGANALVVFSGVVINAVGALFFFMRRESLAQATYYYNRQRFGHSVALCYLMANGLDDAAKQKAVHVIIEKILDRNWGVERPVAPWSRSSKKNNLANQLFRK